MQRNDGSEPAQKSRGDVPACPVFGVESGGPLIGLGALLVLFASVPSLIHMAPVPIPISLMFAGFGIFLIWAGISK